MFKGLKWMFNSEAPLLVNPKQSRHKLFFWSAVGFNADQRNKALKTLDFPESGTRTASQSS